MGLPILTRNPISPPQVHGASGVRGWWVPFFSFLSITKGGPNSFLNVFCGFEIVRRYRALVPVAVPYSVAASPSIGLSPCCFCSFVSLASVALSPGRCGVSFPFLPARPSFRFLRLPTAGRNHLICILFNSFLNTTGPDKLGAGKRFALTFLPFCAASDAAGTLSVKPSPLHYRA